jgi:hypothetical protein
MKGHNNQFACLVNVKPPWFEADANLVDVLQMNAQLVGGKVQKKLNFAFCSVLSALAKCIWQTSLKGLDAYYY